MYITEYFMKIANGLKLYCEMRHSVFYSVDFYCSQQRPLVSSFKMCDTWYYLKQNAWFLVSVTLNVLIKEWWEGAEEVDSSGIFQIRRGRERS